MKKTYKKGELLKAIKRILKEYKNEVHSLDGNYCKLCNLYRNDRSGDECCDLCPMFAFDEEEGSAYPCMNRRCKPLNCTSSYDYTNGDLIRVIEFYKEVIKVIKKMSTKELNNTNFNFLVNIDKKIAKKYYK